MSCAICEEIEDIDEAAGPYTTRKCSACDRIIKSRAPGKHGIGINIEKGDSVILPGSWLQISANPLKGRGHLSRTGLEWYSELVFAGSMQTRRNEFMKAVAEMEDEYEKILKESALLTGLDINSEEQSKAVFDILISNKSSLEWLAYTSALYLALSKDFIEKNDANSAAWAMSCAERLRALMLFKSHFEEVVWMGHSARKLTDILSLWDSNKQNDDEEFWQIQFQSHSLALSQLFSVPVTLIEGKAYVGGQRIDQGDARLVDFLFSGGNASDTMLVEIKTPITKLMLKTRYRKNAHSPSSALAGSIVQVADYRNIFIKEIDLVSKGKYNISTFNPKCIIIIGNTAELDSDEKRRSFELFRSSLSGVEVVTFDEVFAKIENLASIFNLIRKDQLDQAAAR